VNPQVLSALIGGIAAVLAALLAKAYTGLRRSRTPNVVAGWSALNKAIDQERDHALGLARGQAETHRVEMADMQQRHAAELAQARAETAQVRAETAQVRAELAACRDEIQRMAAELYELRRQLNQ
jgi:chromosome segregation ATPase